MKKNITINPKQSATDVLRYDLVKLRSSVADHYAKTYNDDKEKYAFAKLVKVFEVSLEPYMDKEIIKQIMEHYKQLEQDIKELKASELSKETKNHNIILKEFEYAEPIWTMTLRIFHHSPLIEYETEGIIDPRDNGLKERVRNASADSKIVVIDGDEIQDDELPDQ